MRHQLIDQYVKLMCNHDTRWWCINDELHCDDGPAYESTETGYCAWWEHGKFMRNNKCGAS